MNAYIVETVVFAMSPRMARSPPESPEREEEIEIVCAVGESDDAATGTAVPANSHQVTTEEDNVESLESAPRLNVAREAAEKLYDFVKGTKSGVKAQIRDLTVQLLSTLGERVEPNNVTAPQGEGEDGCTVVKRRRGRPRKEQKTEKVQRIMRPRHKSDALQKKALAKLPTEMDHTYDGTMLIDLKTGDKSAAHKAAAGRSGTPSRTPSGASLFHAPEASSGGKSTATSAAATATASGSTVAELLPIKRKDDLTRIYFRATLNRESLENLVVEMKSYVDERIGVRINKKKKRGDSLFTCTIDYFFDWKFIKQCTWTNFSKTKSTMLNQNIPVLKAIHSVLEMYDRSYTYEDYEDKFRRYLRNPKIKA